MRKSFVLFLAFASITLYSCKTRNTQADDFDGITVYTPLLNPEHTPKPVKGEAAAGASRDEGWELPHTEASDSFEEIWDTD